MMKLTLHFPNANHNIIFAMAINDYSKNHQNDKQTKIGSMIQKKLLENKSDIILEIDEETSTWLQKVLTEYSSKFEEKSSTVFQLSCENLYKYTYALLHATKL